MRSIVCAFNCIPWDQGLDLAFDLFSRAGPVKLSPLTPWKEETPKNVITSAQQCLGFEPTMAVQLSNQPWSSHELPLQFMLARARHIIALDSGRKSCQHYFYLKPLFELHRLILHTWYTRTHTHTRNAEVSQIQKHFTSPRAVPNSNFRFWLSVTI